MCTRGGKVAMYSMDVIFLIFPKILILACVKNFLLLFLHFFFVDRNIIRYFRTNDRASERTNAKTRDNLVRKRTATIVGERALRGTGEFLEG